jgi:PAS domain S-box-containing protein
MRDSPTRSPVPGASGLPHSLFRSVFDASPVPMWVYDPQTLCVLAVNGRALQYFGQQRAHFLAIPVTAVAATRGTADERAIQPEGEGGGVLQRYRKPDGTIITMRLETTCIEVDGRPARLVAAIDLTGESRALAGSDARYRDLLTAAAEWVWEWDAELRVSHLSPDFAASTGLRPQSFLGRPLEESAVTAGAADAWCEYRAMTAARRHFRHFVFKVAGGDGRTVWLKIGGTPVFDADGAFQGYRGVGSNATAEVEAALAMRRRDQRYARFFEAGPVWFWENDERYRLTYVSPNANSLLGMAQDDYLGRRLSETPGVMIDPETGKRIIAALKARQPYRDFVYARKRPDGTTVWISTSGAPIFDEDGTYRGFCGISQDVTAQVEAENALRESEQQFRQVLEAAADYYWEQDAKYYHTYLSPSYEKLLGISPGAGVGKRLMDYPGMSVGTEMGKMVLRTMKAKQPYRDFVYSQRLPDGTTHWYKSSGAPFFDRNGEFRGYRGIGADITAHVEAEAATRLAQQRLQEAVAHVSQPIVVYDAEDRLVTFNQVFFDLHLVKGNYARINQGISFRAVAESQLSQGFYADEPDHPALDVETLLEHYQGESEHSYQLRDGRWMLVTYRRLPGGGRVGLWTDVTALKRADAERHALEAQLQHSQRLEALGTLAGGVAHEINNALVPVILLTKMMAGKQPEGSSHRNNLDLVLNGAERTRDLVKQILAFARKEEAERRQESIDVSAVLRDALRLMRATVPASIRFEEEIATTPVITGDPGQLQQVIVNLMTNAAHAIGVAPGIIIVSLQLEADGAHLRLSIADTGCGMDEATVAHVFEPFFTTKPQGEGTGLGLSVVHGIIKTHGGRIEVKSTPGQGTRFDIFLPVTPAGADQAA